MDLFFLFVTFLVGSIAVLTPVIVLLVLAVTAFLDYIHFPR